MSDDLPRRRNVSRYVSGRFGVFITAMPVAMSIADWIARSMAWQTM